MVIFAMLAGSARLLTERVESRGEPTVELRDPLAFYEISSHGPAATEGMTRQVGETQLLYGSDRPVIEPTPTARNAALQENAARLFRHRGLFGPSNPLTLGGPA